MAKKFIEFLEAAALIILTGVIVVGVMKYVDTKEEPKEEDPIVEENQGLEEVTLLEIKYYSDIADNNTFITLTFEEGMTWADWVESKYNTHGFSIDDYYILDNNSEPVMYYSDSVMPGEGISVDLTDVINYEFTYGYDSLSI